MSKRRAEHQLTDRDDVDSFVGDEPGVFAKASAEVMATRKIIKVRRNITNNTKVAPSPTQSKPEDDQPAATETPSSATWPTFSFGSSSVEKATEEKKETEKSWPTFSFGSVASPLSTVTTFPKLSFTPSTATWPTFPAQTTSKEGDTEKTEESKNFTNFSFKVYSTF